MSPGRKRRSGSCISSLVQPQTRAWEALVLCGPGPGTAFSGLLLDSLSRQGSLSRRASSEPGLGCQQPTPPNPAPGGPGPGRHTDVTQALSDGP